MAMIPLHKLRRPLDRRRGAALILSLSMMALVVLLLGTVLSMLLSRRALARRVLVRDLIETDARSAMSSLKAELKSQIQQYGRTDLASWNPGESGLAFGSTPADRQRVFERILSVSAVPSPNVTVAQSPRTLHCLKAQPISAQSIRGTWRTVHPSFNDPAAGARWELSTDLQIFQVPLSAFNFYAASTHTILNSAQPNLGRIHVEGDLQVDSLTAATRPVSCAGELRFGRNGALLVSSLKQTETRAFLGSISRADTDAQADGWIFERNAAPPFLVRPATTSELFSRQTLPSTDKERQRLKPQCAIRIHHTIGDSGGDCFVIEGPFAPADKTALDGFVNATSDTITVDLSKWPASLPWAPSLWLESDQPRVHCITLKGAERLAGDFSLATDLDIHLVGSFNTALPVRKASLLTKGRMSVCR